MEEHHIINVIGRKYFVANNDPYFLKRLSGNPYQLQNLVFARELCPNPRKVVDIGMNIGMNTIEYATFADEVYGFEPFPTSFTLAKKNISCNEIYNDKAYWFNHGEKASLARKANIKVYDVALGDAQKTVFINSFRDDKQNNITVNPTNLEVQQQRLDDYNFQDVDLIKIDVNGYEHEVVKGAIDTISKNRPIIQVNMIEAQLLNYQTSAESLMNWFTKKRYIALLANRRLCSPKWKFEKRFVDRFFVPIERRELYSGNRVLKTPTELFKIKA